MGDIPGRFCPGMTDFPARIGLFDFLTDFTNTCCTTRKYGTPGGIQIGHSPHNFGAKRELRAIPFLRRHLDTRQAYWYYF